MRKVRDMEFYRHKYCGSLRTIGELVRENKELQEYIAAYKLTVQEYAKREGYYLKEIDRLKENN